MSDPNRVYIFDTTLRDGEQSPGASMNPQEKLEIAKQLALLKVDVIEAGFPVSSKGDFEAVHTIAQEVHGPAICALARAIEKDIKVAADALKGASKKRLHTFIATSAIHMEHKLKMTPDQVLKKAGEMVEYAKSLIDEIEFSPEDAGRSEKSFLYEIIELAISKGATSINIPDTVGYTTPLEFGQLIKDIKKNVPNIDQAIISVHCHNDLGLATANSLAAIMNGARQVECTINGIGERAGNASLEEIAMILKTRHDLGYNTNINTKQLIRTSKLVSNISGIFVQANKAIVGANAFAHESGIHQDGMLKNQNTYEIMNPEDVGILATQIPLGPRSGKHALKSRLAQLGFDDISEENLASIYAGFSKLADQKKRVDDRDLYALASNQSLENEISATFELEHVQVTCGSGNLPTASVILRDQRDKTNILKGAELGTGPVDAICKCIRKLTKTDCTLIEFTVKSVTEGIDSLGEVYIRIRDDDNKGVYSGHAAKTDIVIASAQAYLNAINRFFERKEGLKLSPQSTETGV
ncbi:MAG: 2-isopropylmalate synthase [Cyanobacteria bacterium]|nr:2-isopropylmalate synthase [Cyanobacteriota bacterium]MDA1019921.1 2-isopropylmalate synthase [Cyanobacteriota bacterium]